MPESGAQSKARDLLELYEPIFQWVCFVNRAGRKSKGEAGAYNYDQARNEINRHLKDIQEKARQDNYLARQEEKLKPPIIFFINSMVGQSGLDIAQQWMTDLLTVPGYHAARGNVEFFKLLAQTMGDPGDDATERLAVYYVCLGLGFTGNEMKSPEEIDEFMERLRPRVKSLGLLETDLKSPISGANEHQPEVVDVRGQKETRWVVICGILFAVFTAAGLYAYFDMYKKARGSLSESIELIKTKAHGN
jgi:type IV/VI secretion system ImpK/VasF family protein